MRQIQEGCAEVTMEDCGARRRFILDRGLGCGRVSTGEKTGANEEAHPGIISTAWAAKTSKFEGKFYRKKEGNGKG